MDHVRCTGRLERPTPDLAANIRLIEHYRSTSLSKKDDAFRIDGDT